MGYVVVLPKMGVTMVSGMVTQWIKTEGEPVQAGEPLFEVETDKVTQEVESDYSGVLRKVLVEEFERVPISTPIAIIAEPEEDIGPLLEDLAQRAVAGDVVTAEPEAADQAVRSAGAEGQRVPASPRARKLAQEQGIDLAVVPSAGPRVTEDEVKRYMDFAPASGGTTVPYTGTRRIIGEKLLHSYSTKPHIYDMLTVDMSAVMARRAADKQAGREPYSTADYLIMACAHALEANPIVNSTMEGEIITQHSDINIGYAVATSNGLIVPVVKCLKDKDIEEVHRERTNLVDKALHGGLSMEQVTGGTFTISNLGTMGVKTLTAIVNEPEASILAVGAIEKRPVVGERDQILVAWCMDITLCSDHRVVDGFQAANTLCSIKDYLEQVK